MPFRPEPLDIILILIVAILLFGANRIPEVARGLGRGIREFRNGLTGKNNAEGAPTADSAPDVKKKDD